MDNPAVIADLFQRGAIRLQRGQLFDRRVDPKPRTFDFDKVDGMLLGIAIGDALGITTEGMLPRSGQLAHGEVRDYIPNRYVDEAKGFPHAGAGSRAASSATGSPFGPPGAVR